MVRLDRVKVPRRGAAVHIAFVAAAAATLLALSERPRARVEGTATRAEQGQRKTSAVEFRNVAAAGGVRFIHHDSPTGSKYFVDSAPGGLAVFDYNGDGRPDIFFTNGAATPSLEKTSGAYANRLYRNDGHMRFTEVTDVAGVRGAGYAMGAAAADYDNDGDIDLFVAGVRQNQLLRNRGDGRFEDVIKQSGIASGEWAVTAGWFDYDNDGWLDLLVVNYVEWSVEANRSCGDEAHAVQVFCDPRVFKGLPNRLYRNKGDGTFEDVSAKAGLLAHVGKGMSAAFADFNHDGRLDLFVTNDTVPNFLFRNNGDGTFSEDALLAGVSVSSSGRPISSMGTDAQDYDNDGWPDIHFTALAGETFPLFHNDGHGAFVEETQSSGLARLTTKLSGWCSIVADMDNDGWKDIFTANSHVNARIGDFQSIAFKQPNSVFLNDGRGHFSDASDAGFGAAVAAHRGCGVADFDGDGRLDIVVLALGSPAELWQNVSSTPNQWLIVRLVGTKSNRDGIGAVVTIGNQVRTMTTAMGYASSSHAGVHFGLGGSSGPVQLEVQWPSGTKQIVEDVTVDRVMEIREK
ncbi:MAG: CRTAC1 family protein [Vicinamibacterales bacterium]